MDYLPLGNTGLYVSRFCFGAMTFGEARAKRTVHGLATKAKKLPTAWWRPALTRVSIFLTPQTPTAYGNVGTHAGQSPCRQA